MIIEITDFSDSALDAYARLTENQLLNRAQPSEGLFIAESPPVIDRALEAGLEAVSFLMERRQLSGRGGELLSRCGEIPVYTAELSVLTQITGYHLTSGVLCAVRRPQLPPVGELLAGASRVAVLEDVMNPTNLGAIFRSAAALGFEAVLLTSGGCDPLYRRAIRVSMGAVFKVPWTYFAAGEDWVSLLRAAGFETVAMALRNDSLDLRDKRLRRAERLAVVLGTEGSGLKDETIAACDYTVRIPMANGVDSLNVAASSAVAFYELGPMSGQGEA